MSYESGILFRPNFDALAVYCSDGRFCDQCDDFLHNSLKLGSYDRVVLPGGAGTLVGHERDPVDHRGIVEDLVFLMEAHEVERVVMIAHASCGFYAVRLGISESEMEPRQSADLRRAAKLLWDRLPALQIEAYFARRTADDHVRFETVDLEQARS